MIEYKQKFYKIKSMFGLTDENKSKNLETCTV